MNRYRLNGSYTVELCMIFPIVFLVIVFLIDTVFFYYDISLIQSRLYNLTRLGINETVYEINFITSKADDEREEIEMVFAEYAQDYLSKDLLVTSVKGVECSLTGKDIMLSGRYEVFLPGLALMKTWNPNYFSFTFMTKEQGICREERTRMLWAIKNLVKGGSKNDN